MNNNGIKYAYKKNIRLLIPNRKTVKKSLKIRKNHITKQNSSINRKQTHSSAQWKNIYIIKTIES